MNKSEVFVVPDNINFSIVSGIIRPLDTFVPIFPVMAQIFGQYHSFKGQGVHIAQNQ